ncbi:sugar-phosphatase [Aminobacter aminovorans]|uniref:Phosphatase YfbT n=1 Tax=Aminobacter aminovorans TaxID=83263 RepID=A0A380WKE2_AMIAI|nr:HAD-IA family hydrolase [Aminobacter aminovorans]TCS28135.1 sugar-phosphatase [Aminobacter aminovorans]SUU89453.1 Phosphatase YfbT [Aminobacter aminovorans]
MTPPFSDRGFGAFMFDMDGTILSSIASTERVWTAWAIKHGLDVESFLPTIHGVRAYETIRRLNLPGVDVMTEVEVLTQAEFDDIEGIEPILGAAHFLNALPVERWAIVTSAPRRLALRRLEAAGLPVPPIMVTGEDVANGKPAPDCFLLGAQRLGHKAEDCLVFEDAPAGIRAAEAAGAQVLVITATHNHAGDTPHPSVPGYGALMPRLDDTSRLTLARLVALQDAGA